MPKSKIRWTLLFTASTSMLLIAGFSAAKAENWPQWRGPRLDGTSSERNVPTTWTATQNVRWRLPLPGPAGATPVIWEDRIFLTSADGDDLLLLCIGTDGKERWRKKLGSGNRAVRGDEGNSAAPSPSSDGKHVWAFIATGELACFDFDGNEVWKVNLQERYGEFDIQFGLTATPLLDGDRLYMQLLHSKAALVIALDKNTGAEIWRHQRQSDAYAECEHSYTSPVLYRDDERTLLLVHGCDYITAHDIADGREVWRCGGMNPRGRYNPTLRFVASPVAAPGLIVVPTAKNGPILGLAPDGEGVITDSPSQRWVRKDNTPDVPSPLVHDGLVYLCRENGNLLCLDAATGQEVYLQRTHAQRHRASPVYADGKIYLTAFDGRVTVVKAGKQFEILAANDIEESVTASPAIANGVLYLRSYVALYAIGGDGQ